jgi:hypothetical protein
MSPLSQSRDHRDDLARVLISNEIENMAPVLNEPINFRRRQRSPYVWIRIRWLCGWRTPWAVLLRASFG